ncbi:hypothetical protein, partial [Lentibacter sp. XHP0401]|uniref:hypothetical protein n=1 Tax=Lentibacter sp. XHP0401 TaxID=2984334 RepID=UPI0021E7CE22
MSMITVSPLQVTPARNGFSLLHSIQGLDGVDTLEYFVEPTNHELEPVSTSDHALIALLYPAMMTNYSLHFEGELTGELLFKVRHDVMPLLAARDKRLQPVIITAETVIESDPALIGSGIGTGYSGGVDTFATLELYSERHAPTSHIISHLALFGNKYLEAGMLDKGLIERAREFSDAKGYPLTIISSNIESVIGAVDRLQKANSYRQTHSLRSAASAYVLASKLRRYVFSGSYDYRLVTTGQTADIAYADPILMPLLSTVRRQSFWVQERPKLRESLAHLVGLI